MFPIICWTLSAPEGTPSYEHRRTSQRPSHKNTDRVDSITSPELDRSDKA